MTDQASSAEHSGTNCWGCFFFGISHNPATPYACKRMGFQSRPLPAIEVLRADGQPCRGFLDKAIGCQTSGRPFMATSKI